MKIINKVNYLILLFALSLFALSFSATAQTYPTRPIRFIIPFPAGSSSNDILGRALAQKLTDVLGQQVVVDNRSGASGHIGAEIVVRAPPDGYTLLLGVNGTLAIGPIVFSKLPYDPVRDLTPVARFVTIPYAIAIHPSVPANNIKEFIAYAKTQPGKLHFSSSGSGGTPHLCGELLKTMAGIDMVHVPYKGGAPAMVDLLGGQVQLYCSGITATLPHAKGGRLRLIAATTLKRSAVAPDVPTAHESGLAGFDVASWISIMAPANTPRPIVQRLYDAIVKVTNEPTMRNSIIAQGAEPALQTPEEFGVYLKDEIAKWAKVVKSAKVKVD